MKVKVEKLDGLKRRIKVVVPPGVISTHLDEILEDIGKRASIPGFRVGKAPRGLVKKYYSGAANRELLRRVVPHFYGEAMKSEGIQPISEPEISAVSLDDGGSLSFEVNLEVRPVVKLKPYRGIRIKKKDLSVTDEDVEKALEKLRESYAEYITIEDRPAADGDFLVCDVEYLVDSKAINKEVDRWLVLDTSKDETAKALIGSKPGDAKETKSMLPKDYPRAELAGKEANLKVSVKQVKEKRLPELDDEFAKDVGEFEDLKALRAAIRRDLEEAKKREVRRDMENQLLEKLLQLSSFDAPQSLVDKQLERLLELTNRRLAMQGFKKEDIEKQQPSLKERLRPDALKQIKIYFILEKIAGDEDIKVTDEDTEKVLGEIAEERKADKEKLKAEFEKEGRLDDIRLQQREAKTIRFLLEKARVG